MGYGSEAEAARNGGEHPARSLRRTVDRAIYQLRHRGLAVSSAVAYRVWAALLQPGGPRPDARAMAELGRRFEALLARDLANVEDGYYPRALLHQLPVLEYLKLAPQALLDVPRVLWRRYTNRYDELPAGVDRSFFPSYYLRTFHWQTDGWLSERSARLYDASVEFLFGGVADVMRRMAVRAVVDAAGSGARPRVLDVGCGTGRFLLQLGSAIPRAKLYGVDLSPHYLRRASEVLRGVDGVTLANENAEEMPWVEATFDVVTSVFLFHELPPRARRAVAGEIRRVVKPGGAVILCDSAQLSDSPQLKDVLNAFPEAYHEPYYRGYLRDDLARVLAEQGLVVESVEPHLVSKVVVARRPE